MDGFTPTYKLRCIASIDTFLLQCEIQPQILTKLARSDKEDKIIPLHKNLIAFPAFFHGDT
jgi:hypothetical protein